MPPKRKRSDVWIHYSHSDYQQKKCNYCSRCFSKKSSTTTLKTHLLKSHAEIFQVGCNDEATVSTFPATTDIVTNKMISEELNSETKEEATLTLIKMIAKLHLPILMVDKSYFKDFCMLISSGRFVPPCRQVLSKKISVECEKATSLLGRYLSNAPVVTRIIDF